MKFHIMSEWKTYKLGDLIECIIDNRGKSAPISISNYQPIIEINALGQREVNYDVIRKYVSKETYDTWFRAGHPKIGDILFSTVGTIGLTSLMTQDVGCIAQNIIALRVNDKLLNNQYLYYFLNNKTTKINLNNLNIGGVQPSIKLPHLLSMPISLPPLETQKRIADILSAIDDKIELNHRIHANLEQQAQALFDEYFIHNIGKLGNYSTASLTEIAQFLNGLAMQKFRPKGNEDGIPVLKIKELGQGKCDASSDLCSSSIPEEFIINNGDIVFSWSGTLLVDIWCSGICGLNQHLFKVSPLNYPKWLIYFWTKYHLSNFIRIAQDKAVTMGHIKRGDLDAAKVIIPSAESLNELDKIMSPMLQSIISNRIENNNLSTLRDTLLPKLMSGEIIV